MSQTAQIINNRQYLRINNKESGELSVKGAEQAANAILQLSLFKKVSPFYYRNRTRILLTIADEYKHEFIMLRGLTEFNRSNKFLFNYNLSLRTIEVDIENEQLEALNQFFTHVFDLLKQEKTFRHALKLVIELEERHKIERESVYTILNNVTSVARTGR